jgi:hypothetical protein
MAIHAFVPEEAIDTKGPQGPLRRSHMRQWFSLKRLKENRNLSAREKKGRRR